MPLLSIKHGELILTDQSLIYSPSAAELFNYYYSNSSINSISADEIELSGDLSKLRFAKKSIDITYQIDSSGIDVSIIPIAKGVVITSEQERTLIHFGYYVSGNRLYAALDDEVDILSEVTAKQTVHEKTKIIADLRCSSKVSNPSYNVLDHVCNKRGEALCVEGSGVFRHKLYSYQREGVEWLLYCYLNKLGTILGDDMGLGKTAQIIALIAECYSKQLVTSVVIVVPNSLLENWKREFEFFCPSIVPYLHFGSGRVGLAETLQDYLVVLMPYTVMANDIEMLVSLDIDLLVFDEASMLKNPDSERSISACRLNSEVTIAMTGTPVENSLLDIWSISNVVWPGYLGARESFRNRYIDRDISDTLDKDLSVLEVNISQIMIRRMKKDILDDLPEKIDIHQAIRMNSREEKAYLEVIDDIRDDCSDSARVLVEIAKLQQFTSHPVLLDQSESEYSVKQLISKSVKFERLIELLDGVSAQNEKVLVFANHHRMIDLISSSVESRYGINAFAIDGRIDSIERQNIIDVFSEKLGFSVLVLHPKTAGMGLNITAANHVIHYSRQWNPALEEQATARAFRNGQTKNVNAYYLYYSNTIEEVIDERLRMKKQLSDSVVSVVDNKESEMEFYLENL